MRGPWPGFLVVALLAGGASASLVVPEPRGLTELVEISPVIVLARPSARPPRIERSPIPRAPAGTAPYQRSSPAFEVLRVVRGPGGLLGRTLYVDPPHAELFRAMHEAHVRDEPVPWPVLPQYARAPEPQLAPGDDVILFLRPRADDRYEETMLEGRETTAALARVTEAVRLKTKPVPPEAACEEDELSEVERAHRDQIAPEPSPPQAECHFEREQRCVPPFATRSAWQMAPFAECPRTIPRWSPDVFGARPMFSRRLTRAHRLALAGRRCARTPPRGPCCYVQFSAQACD